MGPVVSVMLPHRFSGRDADVLAQMSRLIADAGSTWSGDVHVLTTEPIGGTFRARRAGEARPFGLGASELDAEEAAVAAELRRAFGSEPRSRIAVVAFCNSAIDYRIAGEIALHVAEAIPGSFISFDGDLRAPRSAGAGVVTIDGVSYAGATFLRRWLTHEDFYLIK